MAYSAREASRGQGAPTSLYFFRYGDTPESYYAYTDAEREVSLDFDAAVGPVTFKPIPILRSAIVASGVLDKAPLEIRTPQDAELAELFALYPPSQVITLTIFEGHLEEAEVALIWSGRLLGAGRERNEAVYTCEPVSTSMKRAGLTRNYQYQCPHVLYGPRCRADQGAATITIGVLDVQGPLVVLPETWAADDLKVKYTTGLATWVRPDGRTERRMIVRLEGPDTLVLSGVASGLAGGMAVELTFGCRHDMEDCANLHNNILNFGGQPFIPIEMPLGVKNNFD